MGVVDQLEIQRLGGRAVAYPSSYVVHSILSRYNRYLNNEEMRTTHFTLYEVG